MTTKKATKTHTSSHKKASGTSSIKGRAKKMSAKTSKQARKSAGKRKLTETEWRELQELNLRMAQTVYEDYQQGKFRRLF